MSFSEIIGIVATTMATILSILSFGFAFYSFSKTHSIEKRQLEIEEDKYIGEKTAKLTANIYSNSNRTYLRIENKGNGEARNIKVELDKVLIENHDICIGGSNPIEILCGHGFGDYLIALTSKSQCPKMAEIFWEDDVNKNNSSRISLTVIKV